MKEHYYFEGHQNTHLCQHGNQNLHDALKKSQMGLQQNLQLLVMFVQCQQVLLDHYP